ncbi:MAG: ATP-binding protein [Chloroflexota bacterium]
MDEKTIPLGKFYAGQAQPKPHKLWDEKLDYRALFDQTGECVFIIGLDLHYLAANQQALDLLGYDESELVGLPVSDVMSQDEGLGQESILAEAADLNERILKRKDGSTLPVEISASVIYDERDEPAYIQSIARDISERKASEQALKKYARILSVINDATARLLRSSNLEARLPEVLESLGQAMDVLGCAVFEITTFSEQPAVDVQYEWRKRPTGRIDIPRVIQPHIPSILGLSGQRPFSADDPDSNLSFVIMPIHGTRGSWGFLGLFGEPKILAWSASERDAAEMAANLIGSALQRTSYEETIRLSEARNRMILSAFPDLLMRLDTNGIILDYSANPDHPLYVHRDMISGKNLFELWPEDTVRDILGDVAAQGFAAFHEVQGFKLPISASTYESRLLPISQKEALVVIRDVTEQARLDQMKSDFINRASHELRTPLTSAMLMAELIQEGGPPEEVDQYWTTLRSELNRQKILIDRLLIAGRLESGMMKLEKQPLDLLPILEESIMAVKPIANKRKVVVKLTTGLLGIRVSGDKSGLQQVFINLINNAVKFSRQEGTVDVNVAGTGDRAIVSIADHGMGIPAEALSHLFERFYRARNITIAEIPGSGIGLYIVKSIVDELGGSIEVQSVENQGTTFTVALPIAPPG